MQPKVSVIVPVYNVKAYLPQCLDSLVNQKPCCYMLKSPSDIENKFSELGKQCLDNCYIAYNQEEILDFLNNVIVKGIDSKKQKREQFAHDWVMINYPHASTKIISEIKNIVLK